MSLSLKTSRVMDSATKFESIFNSLDRLFWFTGYKIFDGLWDKRNRQLYRAVTHVLMGMVPILPVIFLIQNFSTAPLEIRIENINNVTQCIQVSFKMLFLHYNHNKLVKLFQRSRCFRSTYSYYEHCIGLVNRYAKLTIVVVRVLPILYLLAVLSQLLFPFLNGGYKEYRLPYMFNLPFLPVDRLDHYMINYAYQLYVGLCIVSFIAGVDLLFMLSISEACLQLDLLTQRFRTIGLKIDGSYLDSNNLNILHILHLDCLSYINSVKNMYTNFVLLQCATGCLLICTFMFALVTADKMTQLPELIVCLLGSLVQLFVFCKCGQMLADKVNDLTTAMYDNEWYNLSLRDQKSLLIMMSLSQKEIYISAMGLGVNLSLDNFVSVMKTAYSYYTIIRRLDA